MMRSLLEKAYEWEITRQCRHFPRHIAIIQDGNRRFARQLGLDTAEGHRAGADKTEQMLDWAHEFGIEHITLYTFSTENFSRNPSEVEDLFALFIDKFHRIVTDERVHTYKIRVDMLGDRTLLPPKVLKAVEAAEKATERYTRLHLHIALAYGGRNEITQAVREILTEVRDGSLQPGEISMETMNRFLNGGRSIPPVDLIIRTGNETRTSNFLPWHANGYESSVYFCAPYWPLFRKLDLLRGIRIYSQRVEAQSFEGILEGVQSSDHRPNLRTRN